MSSDAQHFEPGDPVAWWDDGHGRGAEPDHPGARRHSGVVAAVYRDPADDTRIAAYVVTCRGLTGSYLVTVRPDHGCRLEPDDRPAA